MAAFPSLIFMKMLFDVIFYLIFPNVIEFYVSKFNIKKTLSSTFM